MTLKDFIIENDSVYVAGYSGSAKLSYYGILNSGFSLLHQSQSNYKGITPTGIIIVKNKIMVITTSFSKIEKDFTFSGLYKFRKTSGFSSQSDIGVIAFSNMNTILLGNGPNSYVIPQIDSNVSVKNFGQDTVKSFYLNYYSYHNGGNSNCYFLFHKFYQITVPPGSTVSISTGTFWGLPLYAPFNSVPWDVRTMNFCVFTTVPNNSNDVEINNDAYCDSVFFTVTGIEVTSLLNESIQIYPNPFENDLKIESGILINKIEIMNSIGMLIRRDIVNGNSLTLNTEALSPGIHFINMETEKGRLVKKITKN